VDVLEAELADFVETILSCRYAAGYHDHLIPRGYRPVVFAFP
jgi:hypothetical protein